MSALSKQRHEDQPVTIPGAPQTVLMVVWWDDSSSSNNRWAVGSIYNCIRSSWYQCLHQYGHPSITQINSPHWWIKHW